MSTRKIKVIVVRFDGTVAEGSFEGWWAEVSARGVYREAVASGKAVAAFLYDCHDDKWVLDRSYGYGIGDKPA